MQYFHLRSSCHLYKPDDVNLISLLFLQFSSGNIVAVAYRLCEATNSPFHVTKITSEKSAPNQPSSRGVIYPVDPKKRSILRCHRFRHPFSLAHLGILGILDYCEFWHVGWFISTTTLAANSSVSIHDFLSASMFFLAPRTEKGIVVCHDLGKKTTETSVPTSHFQFSITLIEPEL
eukprot:scaffold316_cov158-Amphora_coffeaeformis.AAC.6